MALRQLKPVTAGTRGVILVKRDELWSGKPVKFLTDGIHSTGGRNNHGHTTARHRGGGDGAGRPRVRHDRGGRRAHNQERPEVGGRVTGFAREAVETRRRAAGVVEEGISSLLSRDRSRAPAPPPREQVRARREDEDDLIAGIGRVDDDMEARFRALEEADEEARKAGK